MEGKILDFDASTERYRALAEQFAEEGDYERALELTYSALKKSFSIDLVMDMADLYADMGYYELSNKYWFIYMDKAPESKVSIAYEELALNFYYMDNSWASGYYFHKKINADGFISKDMLEQDIVDFFEEDSPNGNKIKLVHPVEKSDWSYEIRSGKAAFMMGDVDKMEKRFSSVPEGAPQYAEALDEHSMAEFLMGNTDEALKLSKKICSEKGHELNGYANLAIIYRNKGDREKAEYYYGKACEFSPKSIEEEYKLATASLELCRHAEAEKHIEKIVSERDYELNMRFLLGLVKINLGKYTEARKVFSDLYRLDPTDLKYKYYNRLSVRLEEGAKDAAKYLPAKYEDDLPEEQRIEFNEILDSLYKASSKKIHAALKDEKVIDCLEWGLLKGFGSEAGKSVTILSETKSKKADAIITKALMDAKVSESVKRMLAYILIVNGYKGKFGVVFGNYYSKISSRKIKCEDKENGTPFLIAYAVITSRLLFTDMDDFSVIAKTTDKVYNELNGKDVTDTDALAALITLRCGFSRLSDINDVLEFFSVTRERIDDLVK